MNATKGQRDGGHKEDRRASSDAVIPLGRIKRVDPLLHPHRRHPTKYNVRKA